MANSFDIIISAGNNPYQLWQSMLFHYSCWKHQGVVPLVLVHHGEEPMLEGFKRIEDVGGRIQSAPDYRDRDGVIYSPRNTPVALRCAETNADFVMLCEPDMVFLRAIDLGALELTPRSVTLDRLTYLDAQRDEYQPALDFVAQESGVAPQVLRTCPLNGGVPHIVPIELKEEFCSLWLEGIDRFVEFAKRSDDSHRGDQGIHWVSGMWAYVLAVHRLALKPTLTEFCISNENGNKLINDDEKNHPLIHFCYGDATFDKRDYTDLDAALNRVWQVTPDDGTINGAIRGQLLEARESFEL